MNKKIIFTCYMLEFQLLALPSGDASHHRTLHVFSEWPSRPLVSTTNMYFFLNKYIKQFTAPQHNRGVKILPEG